VSFGSQPENGPAGSLRPGIPEVHVQTLEAFVLLHAGIESPDDAVGLDHERARIHMGVI
jgi:hypothetical protein